MMKKVVFNLNLNTVKIIPRIPKEDIVGTIGIDNWGYFALESSYLAKKEKDEKHLLNNKNEHDEIIIELPFDDDSFTNKSINYKDFYRKNINMLILLLIFIYLLISYADNNYYMFFLMIIYLSIYFCHKFKLFKRKLS